MKPLLLFAFLALAGTAFAALPAASCLDTYPLLGYDFAVSTRSNITCAANISLLYGIETKNDWAQGGFPACPAPAAGGVGYTGTDVRFSQVVNHQDSGTATSTATLTLPTSGTYAFSYTVATGASAFAGATLSGSASGNITEYNSTHMQINAASTAYALKGSVATLTLISSFGATGGGCDGGIVQATFTIQPYEASNPMGYRANGNAGLYRQGGYSYGYYNGYVSIMDANLNSTINLTTSDKMKATLYYSDRLIVPLITYAPEQYAVAHYFNSSTLVSFLPNNTVAYVLDNATLQWYIVPAYSAPTFTDVYTLGTILYSTGISGSSVSFLPLPQYLNCRMNGTSYAIDATWQSSGSQIIYYSNNTTAGVYSAIGTGISYSVDTSTYPNVTYQYNGNTVCSTAGESELLGLPLMSLPDFIKPLEVIIFLSALAVSSVVPFAVIFPIIANDAFSIVPLQSMAVIVFITGVVSAFVNHRGELSMKSLGVYVMFSLALLLYMFTQGGLTTVTDSTTGVTYFASISAAFDSFKSIIEANSSGQAISLFALAATAVNLLIQLALFFITLPLTFGNMLIDFIGLLSPTFATAARLLSLNIALSVAATAYILLKFYEVISNRQIRV